MKVIDKNWNAYREYSDTVEKPIKFTTWLKHKNQKESNDATTWHLYINKDTFQITIRSKLDWYWADWKFGENMIVHHKDKADTHEIVLCDMTFVFTSFDACVNYLRRKFYEFIMEKTNEINRN